MATPDFLPPALLNRRGFVISVGTALLLGACSSREGKLAQTEPSAPGTMATESPASAAAPSASAGRSPAPPVPPRPDRAQIVGKYASRSPRAWGLEPPGIAVRLPEGTAAIALTFDCCGGPGGSGFDRNLLAALVRHQVPATFFLNARWLRANIALTRELAENPLFEIANHGTGHQPLSVSGRSAYGLPGTTDAGMVYDEIMGAQAELAAATGTAPRFFRSGTAHYDDVSVEICRALGLVPVNFTVNGDGGGTYPAATVTEELLSAPPGSIIIAHANRPEAGTGAGVVAALPRMAEQGRTFVRLSDAPPA